MSNSDDEKMIKIIDEKLKNGSFKFKYKDWKHEEERNVFTGLHTKYIEFWADGIAVAREEQMIIDSNGVSHSLLRNAVKL